MNAEACMTFNSCANLTVGRINVASTNSCGNTIAGGCANDMSALLTNCHHNFIGGGRENCVIRYSNNSAIVAGYQNHMGGCCGGSCTGGISSIIGAGQGNCMIYGERQGILAGIYNRVKYAHDSAIVAGCCNTIGADTGAISCGNIIGGGRSHCISGGVLISGIFSGVANNVCANCSVIAGGSSNKICCSKSCASAIVGGQQNCVINNCFSFIGGGCGNMICGTSVRASAILGGTSNKLCHSNSYIIGSNITSSASCYTFMNNSCTFGVTRTFYLVETSAKKHKKCITSLNPQLDNIKKLSPVEFTWKETEREDVGFIAEDIEKVLPKLVSYEENGELHGVQYSKLTAILVKAVQEQQEQIDKLKEEVELLKQNK